MTGDSPANQHGATLVFTPHVTGVTKVYYQSTTTAGLVRVTSHHPAFLIPSIIMCALCALKIGLSPQPSRLPAPLPPLYTKGGELNILTSQCEVDSDCRAGGDAGATCVSESDSTLALCVCSLGYTGDKYGAGEASPGIVGHAGCQHVVKWAVSFVPSPLSLLVTAASPLPPPLVDM